VAFLAARNIKPNGTLKWGLKRSSNFMRSVDMWIWALFFTRACAPLHWANVLHVLLICVVFLFGSVVERAGSR